MHTISSLRWCIRTQMVYDWIWSAPPEGLQKGIYSIGVDPFSPLRHFLCIWPCISTLDFYQIPKKSKSISPEDGSTHRVVKCSLKMLTCEFVHVLCPL